MPKRVLCPSKNSILPPANVARYPSPSLFLTLRLATQRTLVKFARKREFFWSPTWAHAVWAEKSVSASHPIKTLARRLRELASGLDRFKVQERSGVAWFPPLRAQL